MKLKIKKLIKRHVSSLFLLLIAFILLGLAFLISLQTGSSDKNIKATVTPHDDDELSIEISACSEDDPLDEQNTCFSMAMEQSEALMRSLVNELLGLEPDTTRRIAFFEAQRAWEEARDVNCLLFNDTNSDPTLSTLQETRCLLDFNLARVEQLSNLRCLWGTQADCDEPQSSE